MATAYSVPYLPLDSPQFPQPFTIKLPLFKHQASQNMMMNDLFLCFYKLMLNNFSFFNYF